MPRRAYDRGDEVSCGASSACTPTAPRPRWCATTWTGWWSCPGAVESPDQLDLVQRAGDPRRRPRPSAEIKDRILEFLGVRKLRSDSAGPILCFVGPPGVGKTSLGRSIARAMGREFVRISLGGVRDEAEIPRPPPHLRGGAARPDHPGSQDRRAPTIRSSCSTRSTSSGPTSAAIPSAALLEVLDPAQNSRFSDHFLNVPFDLSKVMFIATANSSTPIPGSVARPHGGDRASPATHPRRRSRSRARI